jgi:hypothetical protein
MDPITIIAGATTAFNAIKKGIQVGRELQDMHGQLSQWAGAMSDLGQAEKKVNNPPWWKSLGGSVEAEALQVWNAKRQAEAMRKELRDHISFIYGPAAWDELVRTEAKIRKQKRDHEYRKAEIQEAIITWSISILLMLSGVAGIAFFLWIKYGN